MLLRFRPQGGHHRTRHPRSRCGRRFLRRQGRRCGCSAIGRSPFAVKGPGRAAQMLVAWPGFAPRLASDDGIRCLLVVGRASASHTSRGLFSRSACVECRSRARGTRKGDVRSRAATVRPNAVAGQLRPDRGARVPGDGLGTGTREGTSQVFQVDFVLFGQSRRCDALGRIGGSRGSNWLSVRSPATLEL